MRSVQNPGDNPGQKPANSIPGQQTGLPPAESGPGVPLPPSTGSTYPNATPSPAPGSSARLFGSQLFAQPTIVAQLQSTNPSYLMDRGDRVAINLNSGAGTVTGRVRTTLQP